MSADFVPETRFGKWFLGTQTWNVHVLQRALNDLQRLMPAQSPCDTVLDVGSGFGFSLAQLAQRFSPARIIALDADPEMPEQIQPELARCTAPVELLVGSAAAIPLPDNAVDVVYCHQTFHHLVHQEVAIREFFRVLKPGGLLLFAESTRRYIYSPLIRLLFRHPMHVQKTAEEYIGLIREAGFDLPDERISLPYLWWSRPDIGMWEWLGFKVPATREETLVNAVAVKNP